MFAPPPVVEARQFASLPKELAGKPETSAWLMTQHGGRPMRAFLEGPSFDREGNLYCVDIAYGRILKVSPAGEFDVVAQYDGEPNGLTIHRDGRLFVADHRHGVMVVDPISGRVEPYLTRPGFEHFHGLNDLHFASSGDLYFTDQGQSGLQSPHGRLFRQRADGRLDCLLDNVPSPNGLVLTQDESQVLLAATRANAVWRVRFLPGGLAMRSASRARSSSSRAGWPVPTALPWPRTAAWRSVTWGWERSGCSTGWASRCCASNRPPAF